jgi:hypothetical protein
LLDWRWGVWDASSEENVAASRSAQILRNKTLDDHHVFPHPVKLSMFFVDTHLTKTELGNHIQAGIIFEKYSRKKFPISCCSGGFDEGAESEASGSPAAATASGINGNFGDPGVALARTILRSCGERDWLTVVFDDHNRVNAVEPAANVITRSGPGFESRYPVFDAFVIDAGNCAGVLRAGWSCGHRQI